MHFALAHDFADILAAMPRAHKHGCATTTQMKPASAIWYWLM